MIPKNSIYSEKKFKLNRVFSMNTTRQNPLLKFVMFILLLVSLAPHTSAQLKDKTLSNYSSTKELFYADPLVFYNKDSISARLDLYVEIPYDGLQLKKNSTTKNLFADIIITAKITNDVGTVIANESYNETITITPAEAKNYKDNSRYIVKTFSVNPGTYAVAVTVKDNGTRLELTKNYTAKAIDHKDNAVFTSDLMIVSNYERDAAGKKKITPSVNNNLGVLKDFYIFYEIYNAKDENIEVNYSYIVDDSKNSPVVLQTNKYYLSPGVNKIIEKLSAEKIMIGDYRLELKDNATGSILETKNIINRWTDFPVTIKDIDAAINQLQYIASSDEMSKMKDAKTTPLKEKAFIDFWKMKDPSQGTPRNELMVEYYNRIKIANERYSHYVDGWKTDMGMVFIIYGNPNNIDRHPFENQTKPYEVWDYYDINRQFVFVDDSGFGDYRLITPIYDNFRMR